MKHISSILIFFFITFYSYTAFSLPPCTKLLMLNVDGHSTVKIVEHIVPMLEKNFKVDVFTDKTGSRKVVLARFISEERMEEVTWILKEAIKELKASGKIYKARTKNIKSDRIKDTVISCSKIGCVVGGVLLPLTAVVNTDFTAGFTLAMTEFIGYAIVRLSMDVSAAHGRIEKIPLPSVKKVISYLDKGKKTDQRVAVIIAPDRIDQIRFFGASSKKVDTWSDYKQELLKIGFTEISSE